MKPVIHRTENPPGNRISVYELLLLAALVAALTIAAAWVYPIWDDGRLMFLIKQSGNSAIKTNFGDRPLLAVFFTFLSNHQPFLPLGLVFHWITWLSMGLITMRFWRLMFPAYSRYALLPAVIAVAPVLCKVQLVIVTVVFVVLLGPELIFLALFMLLSEQPSLWRKLIVKGGALGLAAFAILISEYAVPTAAVAFVIFVSRAIRSGPQQKRENTIIAGLIAVVALGSYLIFSLLTKTMASAPYRPSFVLQSLSWKGKVMPFRLLSGLWRGAMGGVMESHGSVTLNSKSALLSFVCGAVFSGLVAIAIYKKGDVNATNVSGNSGSVITLLAAAGLALTPVLLMDRTLDSRWDSRFFLPLMPVLSSLTVFIFVYVIRSRLWILTPVLCGFLAGYWTPSEIARAIQNPEPIFVKQTPTAYRTISGSRCHSAQLEGLPSSADCHFRAPHALIRPYNAARKLEKGMV
jgi:hypothetical protein